jgi:threonine/homoserine/homoserine lactone efflux protein
LPQLVALFVTSFLVGFSGAAMPGPLTVTNLQQTARRGVIAAPLVWLGHTFAEVVITIALLLGLGPLLAQPPLTIAVALAGAAVLGWMGVGMVRQAHSVASVVASASSPGGLSPLGAGVAATASNPYWFLWWATAGAGYLTLARPLGWPGVAAFFLGHIFSDLVWLSALSVTLARGRNLMSPGSYRLLLTTLGAFLCALAGGSFIWALRLLAA